MFFFESNHWKDAKFWGAGCSPIWSSFRIYQVFYCLILFQFVRFTKFIEIRFLKSTLRKFQTSAKLQFDWHIYNFDVFEDLEWKEDDKNIGSHNWLSFLTRCVCLLCWFEAKNAPEKAFFEEKIEILGQNWCFEVQTLKYGDYSPKIIYWKSDANSCFSRHTVSSEENGVRVGSLASQSIFDQTHFWAVITTEPGFSFFEVFNFRLKM